jgi:hypothetical protein
MKKGMTIMPTETAPVSRVNPLTLQRQAAEAAAAAPPWTPTLPQQKPKPPAVQARLEEAANIRSHGLQLASQADSMTTAAKILEQKLSSLNNERAELLSRIGIIESRNFAAEKAQAQDTFNRFYGVFALETHQLTALNAAIIFLDTVAVTERLAPPLAKKLKLRVSDIDEEIANLTAPTKTK